MAGLKYPDNTPGMIILVINQNRHEIVPMTYQQKIIEELNLLLKFNLETTLEGIKIHSTAAPEMIAAAQRLHEKGMITRNDGGYLTDLGHEAAEHAQALLLMMTEPREHAHKHTPITG